MKKIKILVMIVALFNLIIGLSLVNIGQNLVSAEEKEKNVVFEEQKELKVNEIELKLPQRNTRSLNQFQQYYSNIETSDIIGSQTYLTMLNCNNYLQLQDYIYYYFNETVQINTYYTYNIIQDVAISLYNNNLENEYYKYTTLYNIRIGNFNDRIYVEFNTVAYYNQSNSMYIGYTYSLNYYSNSVESNSQGNIFDCIMYVTDTFNSNLLNNINIVDNYNNLSYNLLNYKVLYIELQENSSNITINYPLIFDNVYNNSNTKSQFITSYYYYITESFAYPITINTNNNLNNEQLQYNDYTAQIIVNIPTTFTSGYCILYLHYDYNYIKYSSSHSIISKQGNVIPLVVQHYNITRQIETPEISIEFNTISWQAIENATAYEIYMNGILQATTNNTQWVTITNGTYQVKAITTISGYTDSELSNSIVQNAYNDIIGNGANFYTLIGSIMDSEIYLIKSLLNYTVWGINFFDLFKLFITACLIIIIIKLALKNKG